MEEKRHSSLSHNVRQLYSWLSIRVAATLDGLHGPLPPLAADDPRAADLSDLIENIARAPPPFLARGEPATETVTALEMRGHRVARRRNNVLGARRTEKQRARETKCEVGLRVSTVYARGRFSRTVLAEPNVLKKL